MFTAKISWIFVQPFKKHREKMRVSSGLAATVGCRYLNKAGPGGFQLVDGRDMPGLVGCAASQRCQAAQPDTIARFLKSGCRGGVDRDLILMPGQGRSQGPILPTCPHVRTSPFRRCDVPTSP